MTRCTRREDRRKPTPGTPRGAAGVIDGSPRDAGNMHLHVPGHFLRQGPNLVEGLSRRFLLVGGSILDGEGDDGGSARVARRGDAGRCTYCAEFIEQQADLLVELGHIIQIGTLDIHAKVVVHIKPRRALSTSIVIAATGRAKAVAAELHVGVLVTEFSQLGPDVRDLLVVLLQRVGRERRGGTDSHEDDCHVGFGRYFASRAGVDVGCGVHTGLLRAQAQRSGASKHEEDC